MTKKKQLTTIVDSIPETDLPAWKRSQWFETSKLIIQIILMGVMSAAAIAFLFVLFLSGFLPICQEGVNGWCLPGTEGVRALSALFVDVAGNAKAIALFALGFFFKEYLNASGIGKK